MAKIHDDYDIIILDGGSAGIVSGVMAGGLKLRALVLEKYRLGGECLNTGCMPSKALFHAAKTAHALRTAAAIGLKDCPLAREDAAGVLRWVRSTIDRVRVALGLLGAGLLGASAAAFGWKQRRKQFGKGAFTENGK